VLLYLWSRMRRCSLKRARITRFFASSFFHKLSSPRPLKITLGSFWIFLKIHRDIRKSRCTTGISDTGSKFAIGTAGGADTGGKFTGGVVLLHRRQIFLWCSWYQWQIMGTISDCLHLKVNLMNLPIFNSTTQRLQTIYLKLSDWRFFHLHLELRISPRIFEKIWNGLMDT
jgi:hypothetical protein